MNCPEVRHISISVARVDFFKFVAQVPFDVSCSVISLVEKQAASLRKQRFLVTIVQETKVGKY